MKHNLVLCARDWTQSFVHTRQALYQLSYTYFQPQKRARMNNIWSCLLTSSSTANKAKWSIITFPFTNVSFHLRIKNNLRTKQFENMGIIYFLSYLYVLYFVWDFKRPLRKNDYLNFSKRHRGIHLLYYHQGQVTTATWVCPSQFKRPEWQVLLHSSVFKMASAQLLEQTEFT